MAELMPPAGFLGPTLLEGGRARYLAEALTNAAGNALLAGEVVRINGNLTMTRARANLPANAAGVVGVTRAPVAAGAAGAVTNAGLAFVLLEAALAPVAGEALWLSAATAGRATNVAPALPLYLGVIKDASMYGTTGGVLADLMPSFSFAALATLHAAYNYGVAAAAQEMIVTDAHGGGIVINATTPPPLYTGVTAFEVDVIGGSANFYRAGGCDVSSPRGVVSLSVTGLSLIKAKADQASATDCTVENLTASGEARYIITTDAGVSIFGAYGSTHAPFGVILPASLYIFSAAANGIAIMANTGTIRFAAGGNNEAMRITTTGVLAIGSTVAGATAANCIALSNSAIAPTTSVDLAHLYSADIAAGRATLAIYAEEAVAADVGLASTHSFIVFIDGAKYKLMLVSVP